MQSPHNPDLPKKGLTHTKGSDKKDREGKALSQLLILLHNFITANCKEDELFVVSKSVVEWLCVRLADEVESIKWTDEVESIRWTDSEFESCVEALYTELTKRSAIMDEFNQEYLASTLAWATRRWKKFLDSYLEDGDVDLFGYAEVTDPWLLMHTSEILNGDKPLAKRENTANNKAKKAAATAAEDEDQPGRRDKYTQVGTDREVNHSETH